MSPSWSGRVPDYKIEGKGEYTYQDGEKYEGEFKNGIREGFGKYFYNNGDRYEGDFKNGVRDGKGIIYYGNEKRKVC